MSACAVSGRAAVTNLTELRGRLDQAIASSSAGGTLWGVKVASLRTGRTWYETNAASRMVPASNTKLFTGALALDRLGPDRRLFTSLKVTNAPDAAGRLAGPLRITGGGDPTLCARLHGGSWDRTWAPLVEAVKAAGIRRVDGDLVCDESRFVGPPYGSGWNWDDLAESYGAAISALSAGDNLVSVVVSPGSSPGAPATARLDPPLQVLSLDVTARTSAKGSPAALSLFRLPGDSRLRIGGTLPLDGAPISMEATVPSPAVWFGMLFGDALRKAGIVVSGKICVVGALDRETTDDSRWKVIASVPSPPLADVLREMMKPSQNLYAQLLWLAVGADASPGIPEGGTTEEAGARALNRFLPTAGIHAADVQLEEGSGLSRKNLITPRAAVQLLAFMARHRSAEAWRASLPVGGVDGTLRYRFTQPGMKGNVRAKTGTLRHVNALSGYLTNAVGEPLVFSILVNNHVADGSGMSARDQADALVELIARSVVRDE